MIQDYQDVQAVNQEMEKMGYNIGVRLIDEFLAKSAIPSCNHFRDTADVIAKVALKMFLGITADVTQWSDDGHSCSLIISSELPFIDFVELPVQYHSLVYCNMLCGIIRGALEMVQLRVECQMIKDVLKGDEYHEIRLTLKEIMQETFQDDDE